MSTQNPIIPTPTQARGIDAVVLDLQTHLSSELSWLSNPMGRAFRLSRTRGNGSIEFKPMIYLGGTQQDYHAAVPDNENEGQTFILVGDSTPVIQIRGHYGRNEYPVSIIFSANLKKIDATLLLTEDFTEHLMDNVRQALIRDTVGRSYELEITKETRDFDEVYSEFDVNEGQAKTRKQLLPMTYFRFDCLVRFDESCPALTLDRCAALQQNLSQEDLTECIQPLYIYSQDVYFNALNGTQITDLTNRLCAPPMPTTSILFDGVNESITSFYDPSHELERTDSFSIAGWVKIPSYKTVTMVGKYNLVGIHRGWYFQINFEGKIRFVLVSNEVGGNLIFINGSTPVSLNNWAYVGLSYIGNSDESGFQMYCNGLPDSHTAAINNLTGTTVDATKTLKFGDPLSVVGTNFFEGGMFQVDVWKNRVLTPAEWLFKADPDNIGTQIHAADLAVSNKLGTGSLYGVDTLVFPDETGLPHGYQGSNFEPSDIVNDIPT